MPALYNEIGIPALLRVIIWVFVPDTASMIRRPHTGQQTGRRVVLSPLVCASFFLRISYTPLSVAAAVRRGRVYDLLPCFIFLEIQRIVTGCVVMIAAGSAVILKTLVPDILQQRKV